MFSKKIRIPLFVFLVFAFLLGACTPGAATPDAQQVAGSIATAVEMTVIAKSTEDASQMLPTPVPPTDTATPTSTAVLPPTPLPTNTPFTLPTTTTSGGGSSSGGSSGGSSGSGGGGSGGSQNDRLDCSVVAQKPYDGQFIYKPGDSFDVEWVIKNTGLKQWEPTWAFQYFSDSGTRLSPTANTTLGQIVEPGDTITLRIEIIAPDVSGREKETFVEQWAIIGDGVKFCRPYIAIFVQKP